MNSNSVQTNEGGQDMDAMKLKFGGGNEIDANTLINSLIHFTNIVQEVNKDLSKELNVERNIEIKIKANAPGSFLVDFAIVATSVGNAISNMFSKEAIGYASNLISTVGGVYNFAKFLRGKKPQTITQAGNSINVTTTDGNVVVYDFSNANFRGANIYLQNPTVQTAVAKEFETLDSDTNVTSFEILDNNNQPIAEIGKEDFSDLAEPEAEQILITGENGRVITVPATLQIKTQDWTFKKA